MNNQIIIDASNTVLGRLASYVAKQALLGKSVIILNCDDVLITGNRKNIYLEYRTNVTRGGSGLKGPKIPRKSTERYVKRTVRGMLSHKQQRGRDALNRIRCYSQIPQEYVQSSKTTLPRQISHASLKLSELLREA
ncbi:50S ribosomal protein L13 [Candidatus Pacearchaeota archaeon]|nr:50S ribosomal protein L13 [Candidatus Pacearchaeota archaeon]